jgi:hypothetical protein
MALSNQSEIPAFFSPWKVNLKISHRLPRLAKSRNIIYSTENDRILEDNLSRLAKSRLTTSRNLKGGFNETSGIRAISETLKEREGNKVEPIKMGRFQ